MARTKEQVIRLVDREFDEMTIKFSNTYSKVNLSKEYDRFTVLSKELEESERLIEYWKNFNDVIPSINAAIKAVFVKYLEIIYGDEYQLDVFDTILHRLLHTLYLNDKDSNIMINAKLSKFNPYTKDISDLELELENWKKIKRCTTLVKGKVTEEFTNCKYYKNQISKEIFLYPESYKNYRDCNVIKVVFNRAYDSDNIIPLDRYKNDIAKRTNDEIEDEIKKLIDHLIREHGELIYESEKSEFSDKTESDLLNDLNTSLTEVCKTDKNCWDLGLTLTRKMIKMLLIMIANRF